MQNDDIYTLRAIVVTSIHALAFAAMDCGDIDVMITIEDAECRLMGVVLDKLIDKLRTGRGQWGSYLLHHTLPILLYSIALLYHSTPSLYPTIPLRPPINLAHAP